ncbi:phosphonate ABC transporter, permease protein PhnE [Paucibacter sp. DJ1R-11]|uniref:phosphonate ABC transporter, permease protein PhnE n=1 Tax=Paucibacter sp. DJ1R-11 TaxID=2893556 RepID=UPI0021E3D3CF|nr:phosphonate ABC transporter, permease protein PhnE [Paucibacter sp. DJ1R-11]MCV2362684.1 phosphonate ABC transporter, permease protein PhnE [Paucibacter sp. DJ1R-11]
MPASPLALPPELRAARRRAWALLLALAGLVVASFASLDLPWGQLLSLPAWQSMARFGGEFFPPETRPDFLLKVARGAWETLAMSALGTLLAVGLGLLLALPAGAPGAMRAPTRWLLNALRAVPELVWASLLLISVGLGPMAGTLALALHTGGVLGRLFAEALENLPTGPAQALRHQGVGALKVFFYAQLPQALPQWLSYTLYRWENNIRAAAMLGVVGAGGLGQQLAFHLGLFQMGKTATVLIAMLGLVGLVDGLSGELRWRLGR